MRLTILCAAMTLGFAAASCAGTPAAEGDATERGVRCPEGRDIDQFPCPRLVTWARDPDTGQCCRYEAQCASPVGWKTYATEATCEEASRKD